MFIPGTGFYRVFDPLKKLFRFWSDSGGSELKKIFQPVMVFPGGLSGLGLAAAEVGANAPVVILSHVIRIVILILAVPVVAKIVCR